MSNPNLFFPKIDKMLLITKIIFIILFDSLSPKSHELLKVKEVISCNEFQAYDDSGNYLKFRLIGIKCLQSSLDQPDKDNLSNGITFLARAITDKVVLIEYDKVIRDSDGSMLVYAYTLDGLQLNRELVRNNLVGITTKIPNIRYAHQYYDLRKNILSN